MDRTGILRSLLADGTGTGPSRCAEIAAEVCLPASDVLTIAGHPVPTALLPPPRDARVMKEFAYRASYCNHAHMATLMDFIENLTVTPDQPTSPPVPTRNVYAHPDVGHFASVLDGFLRNRGFGPKELPFTGLSMSTILGSMLTHDRRDEHRWFQLSHIAGPLGWQFEDLITVADEPPSQRPRYALHCHHLGQVFIKAIPLTTEQLIEAAKQADRLSHRPDQGAWRPVAPGSANECPDLTDLASPA